MRKLLAIFALIVATVSAVANPIGPLLWQQSVHDGISLDFERGRYYVKSPGQAARFDKFESLFTFTRNSVGTYRAQSGLIAYANENLNTRSQEFNLAWSLTNVSVIADNVVAPDGTLTADTLNEGVATGAHGPSFGFSLIPTQSPHTISMYIKGISVDRMQGRLYFITTDMFGVNYDLTNCSITGTVTTAAGVVLSSGAQSVGNGWCRVWVTGILGAQTSGSMVVTPFRSGAQSYTGEGIDAIAVWGAQAQRGLNVGLYLPTTGAAKYDQPRIEYDASGNALGLLVEGARTNISPQSEVIDNASWTKTDTTITANSIAAPDGNTTADLLTEGSAGTASVFNSVTITASVTHTASGWLKRGNNDWVRVQFFGGAGTNVVRGWVNTSTCAAGSVANAGAATGAALSVASFSSGWCRWMLSGTVSPDVTGGIQTMSASADASTTRTNNATYYLWGAQLEQAAFASSYIPTTTTSVARSRDAAIMTPGQAFSTSVGTLFAEADFSHAGLVTDVIFGVDANGYFYANGGNPQIYDGTNVAFSGGGPPAAGVMIKAAAAYGTGGMAITTNGAAVGASAFDGTFGAASTVELGAAGGASPHFGHIRRFDYWPERKPNSFLQFKTLPGRMTLLLPANDNDARRVA